MFGTVLTTIVTILYLYVFWRVASIAPLTRHLPKCSITLRAAAGSCYPAFAQPFICLRSRRGRGWADALRPHPWRPDLALHYLVRLRYLLIAGRYQVGGMTVIVCRGTGTWGPRMRLWPRGEIMRVTLRAHAAVDLGR